MSTEILEVVPRVAVGHGRVWADGRGLAAVTVAEQIVERVKVWAGEVGCGVAATAVAAYAAAVDGSVEEAVRVVASGEDARFVAGCPLGVLEPGERLRTLLEGVGIETCGDLAAIPGEAVEVRFGPEAVRLWRLSRADDERRLFHTRPTDRPQASLDFIDYVVTDPEQLAFTANALLNGVSESLVRSGSHARRMEMVLPLANGETWRKVLRPARPTASRAVWLRLIRRILERLTVPDAVTGIRLDVLETEVAAALQGDLFDVGFATSSMVEAALTRLIEMHGPIVVKPEMSAHPRVEKRTEFVKLDTESVAEWSGTPVEPVGSHRGRVIAESFGLTLQLLTEPKRIRVETQSSRDHESPVRYHDGEWKRFDMVAGPERISGGQWEDAYAREYFRGATNDGQLLWIYRDALTDQWFLHGWWD